MELAQELETLKNENKMYKEFLEGINAEKVALDQLLVESLKTSLQAKKEAVLNGEKVKKLTNDIEILTKEKEILQEKCNSLEKEKALIPVTDI